MSASLALHYSSQLLERDRHRGPLGLSALTHHTWNEARRYTIRACGFVATDDWEEVDFIANCLCYAAERAGLYAAELEWQRQLLIDMLAHPGDYGMRAARVWGPND